MTLHIRNILLTILIQFLLLVIVDIVFGLFVEAPLGELNQSRFPYVSYPTNYRNYFDKAVSSNGETYYTLNMEVKDLPKFPDVNFKGKKVIVLGDSFAEGHGVRRHHTFAAQLSTESDDQVRGYNWGKAGLNTKKIVNLFLKKNVYKEKADLYVYAYVLNDPVKEYLPEKLPKLERASKKTEHTQSQKWDLINLRTINIEADRSLVEKLFFNYSNIINYFGKKLERAKLAEKTIRYYNNIHDLNINKKGLEKTIDFIGLLREKIEAKGARFVVAILPILYWKENNYPMDSAHKNFQSLLEEKDIQFIDLRNSLMKYPAEDLWVHPVDQHPNSLAHKIIAKEILKYLK